MFCSFCFINNVHAEVKCIYNWEWQKGKKVKIVLSKPDSNKQLTKVNWSGLSAEAKIELKNKPKLTPEGRCPSISVYYGDVVGIQIWSSQEKCKKNKKGFLQGSSKKCSKNISGELDSSGQSGENAAGVDQFRLEKKTNSSCEYIREYLKDSVTGSKTTKTSYTITISDSQVKGKVKGSCAAKNRLSSCAFKKIEKEAEKNFHKNSDGSGFVCPSYIYASYQVSGPRDIYYYTVTGTGTTEDEDQSVVDEDSNTTHGAGYVKEEWLPETEGPTKEECKSNPNQPGCAKSSCEVIDTNGEVFKILKQILGYIQIGSVFAVLVFCILDFGGAVASSDDDAFRKARKKVMNRIIALILIFLVPLFINFVINLVNLGACSEEDYDFIGNLFN